MSSFQIFGLHYEPFAPLFEFSNERLAAQGVRRVVADKKPGYPCRVSLIDAEIGEELLLLPYAHQSAESSPYKASGPIYVRKNAERRIEAVGVTPECVRHRVMSVRAYDATHAIIASEACDGSHVAQEIRRLFDDSRVQYIHLHNAKPGCFSCFVGRA